MPRNVTRPSSTTGVRGGGVAVVRLGLLDLDPVVRRRVAEDQHAAAGRAGSKLDQRRGLDEFARIGRAGAVVVAAAILLVLRELEDGAAADGVRRVGEEVVGGVGGAVGEAGVQQVVRRPAILREAAPLRSPSRTRATRAR